MDEIATDLSPEALVRGIVGNLAAYVLFLASAPGTECDENPRLTWAMSGIPSSTYSNSVVRTDLAPEEADEAIAAVLARFRARSLPLGWWVTPSSRPLDLAARLAARGLAYLGEGPGMALDLALLTKPSSAPQGLVVEETRDLAGLRTWLATEHAAFTGEEPPDMERDPGMALELRLGVGSHLPLRRFLGRVDGVPVATAALFLGAGVAGIYAVGTLAEQRGRGIGAAMPLAPLWLARTLGYRIAVLQSSPLGQSVYMRLGFHECCRLARYTWPPE